MTSTIIDDLLTATISNKRGLHARASAKFVSVAGDFDAKLTVSKDGTSVCATSIMGLMMLAAAIGDQITVKGEGPDKDRALIAIEELINDKFGEEC
ncbi:HPr family phosphocarrier protein [Pseudemcibacter aquimaris]|uniref:HPr family phosphocarrier protein n=1 Tax=Pseudemcibacter aquimaris TaxID=2857064 RepID=UPI002012D7DB|nr:HPr family phosphocarrier protein [Pseudemcibacter aquimaris]MCC3860275.1 HPr family phosphocarrier protein [Pseudemcibacter aquimaris]WDU57600.1 HPr family phosphocarrier protein [Pseudemcibacter aquimaris]